MAALAQCSIQMGHTFGMGRLDSVQCNETKLEGCFLRGMQKMEKSITLPQCWIGRKRYAEYNEHTANAASNAFGNTGAHYSPPQHSAYFKLACKSCPLPLSATQPIALADNEKLQHCHDEKHVVRVNVVNGLDSTL